MNRFGARLLGMRFGQLALLGAGLAILPASASVDSFEQKHHAAVLQNPPGVDFTIRFPDDRRVFQQGETIRIEMEFSSRLEQTYQLDTANYDRSGRLWIDSFFIDPEEGSVDPLDEYFKYGPFIGGGLRGMPALGTEPMRLVCELNEWFRFDRPGSYRLFIVSDRPSRLLAEGGHKPLPTTSNVIQFEIIPADPGWAEEQVQQAVGVLGSSEAPEERRAAARTLRFLGSETAVKEMARRFREEGALDHEYRFGLFGSPHRSFVISEMERLLDDPSHLVTESFLNTLALLVTLRDHPEAGEMSAAIEKRRQLYAERAARARRR